MLDNRKVIIYKIDGCPKCKFLTDLLNKNSVTYEICMDLELMEAKGFREAPKLEIDGIVYGYADSVKILNGKMEV